MNKSIAGKILVLIAALALIISALVLSAWAEPEPESDVSESTIASKKLKVKSIKYQHSKRLVEFKFNQKVKYKNPKVVIRYKNGYNKVIRIRKKDSTSLQVRVWKLKYGFEYSYKITGIKKAKAKKYTTLKGTFRAVE